MSVFDRRLVAIQFRKFPNVSGQWHPTDSIRAKKSDRVRLLHAQRNALQFGEFSERQRHISHDLPCAVRIALAKRERLAFGVQKEKRSDPIRSVAQRRGAYDA